MLIFERFIVTIVALPWHWARSKNLLVHLEERLPVGIPFEMHTILGTQEGLDLYHSQSKEP